MRANAKPEELGFILARRDHLAERLLSARHITENGCWEWTKNRNEKGYGRIVVELRPDRRPRYVHRIAAMIWCGFDPASGLDVLHVCDNPPCFHPFHLISGTPQQNILEALERGLRVRRTNTTLTEEDVRSIRLAATIEGTQRRIAQAFHVSDATVSMILNGHTWKDVT